MSFASSRRIPTTEAKVIKKLLQETDGADDPQREYKFTVEEYGDLLSDFDGSDSSYFQFDGLGSTDALLDESGTQADRRSRSSRGT